MRLLKRRGRLAQMASACEFGPETFWVPKFNPRRVAIVRFFLFILGSISLAEHIGNRRKSRSDQYCAALIINKNGDSGGIRRRGTWASYWPTLTNFFLENLNFKKLDDKRST